MTTMYEIQCYKHSAHFSHVTEALHVEENAKLVAKSKDTMLQVTEKRKEFRDEL